MNCCECCHMWIVSEWVCVSTGSTRCCSEHVGQMAPVAAGQTVLVMNLYVGDLRIQSPHTSEQTVGTRMPTPWASTPIPPSAASHQAHHILMSSRSPRLRCNYVPLCVAAVRERRVWRMCGNGCTRRDLINTHASQEVRAAAQPVAVV